MIKLRWTLRFPKRIAILRRLEFDGQKLFR